MALFYDKTMVFPRDIFLSIHCHYAYQLFDTKAFFLFKHEMLKIFIFNLKYEIESKRKEKLDKPNTKFLLTLDYLSHISPTKWIKIEQSSNTHMLHECLHK
jgi:hypothetical protein